MNKSIKAQKTIKYECKHDKYNYVDYKIKPFHELRKEYREVFNYLLYDVEEWKHNKYIVEEKWEAKYNELLDILNIKLHAEYGERSSGKYKEVELDKEEICFECQRLCMSKASKEDSLSALYRHLRNSIAHGQVYLKDNKYFLFQDLDEKKHVTARIVINKDSLFKLQKETLN